MIMKKARLYELSGNVKEEISLPKIFSTPYRPDVIKRAVLAEQSADRQPYGSDPLAGKRTSAHYHGKRRYRWAMMNREMSRIPRIHGKVGYMVWRARFAPHAVKGRRAHPPKAEKIWEQKINTKEKILAIKSALAASADMELVRARGHKTEATPIIFTDEFEKIKKTKDVEALLEKIIKDELKRCREKKVRAGKGKMRGRKYRKKKGPVIITDEKSEILKSAKNIAGVDAISISEISAEMLAPGAHAGRLLITTESTLKKIQEKFGE